MRILYKLKKEFYLKLKQIDNYEEVVKKESMYFQHGTTTVYKHSKNVAFYSLYIAQKLENKFKIKFNYDNLIIGAFLHDLFLYDWHEADPTHRLHGFTHPLTASINAKRMCNVDEKVANIIRTHMWPLTITKVPTSREAFLVCMADKLMATKEVINNFKRTHKVNKTTPKEYNKV